MQRTVEKVFFALIRFEINGSELCEEIKNLITPEVLPALFKLSKRYDLAHLIGDALEKTDFCQRVEQESISCKSAIWRCIALNSWRSIRIRRYLSL